MSVCVWHTRYHRLSGCWWWLLAWCLCSGVVCMSACLPVRLSVYVCLLTTSTLQPLSFSSLCMHAPWWVSEWCARFALLTVAWAVVCCARHHLLVPRTFKGDTDHAQNQSQLWQQRARPSTLFTTASVNRSQRCEPNRCAAGYPARATPTMDLAQLADVVAGFNSHTGGTVAHE